MMHQHFMVDFVGTFFQEWNKVPKGYLDGSGLQKVSIRLPKNSQRANKRSAVQVDCKMLGWNSSTYRLYMWWNWLKQAKMFLQKYLFSFLKAWDAPLRIFLQVPGYTDQSEVKDTTFHQRKIQRACVFRHGFCPSVRSTSKLGTLSKPPFLPPDLEGMKKKQIFTSRMPCKCKFIKSWHQGLNFRWFRFDSTHRIREGAWKHVENMVYHSMENCSIL